MLQNIGGSIVKHNKLKQWGFHCIVNLGIFLLFNIIYDAKVLSVLLNGRNGDNTDMQWPIYYDDDPKKTHIFDRKNTLLTQETYIFARKTHIFFIIVVSGHSYQKTLKAVQELRRAKAKGERYQ